MHPGSLARATNRARVQQQRFIWRAWSGPMRGVRCQPISDFENSKPDDNGLAATFCGQRDASMHPGSLAGATHRARVQRRRVFARGWSRPIRMVAPRGARLPPSRTQISRSDNTDLAHNESHQSTRVAIRHRKSYPVALDSHAIAEIVISAPK